MTKSGEASAERFREEKKTSLSLASELSLACSAGRDNDSSSDVAQPSQPHPVGCNKSRAVGVLLLHMAQLNSIIYFCARALAEIKYHHSQRFSLGTWTE
jgi:hypothetical protein